jgi:VIT1/CCC1 family predicted Fe2+/Mn2+ transporter
MVPTPEPSTTVPYEPHVGITRQYWRDIVLGVNDGLVSVFLLIAGVVGGGLTSSQVLLTGIAGAIAGAISMAAGEFLATQSQEEVLDREITRERTHIQYFRAQEVEQLYGYFREMGVREESLDTVVAAFNRDDETLLNAMKRLEFGVVESERRSPLMAMVTSGTLFLAGSLPPVAPFLFGASPSSGLAVAAVLTAIGLFAVGVAKTKVTGNNPIRSGLENLVIAGIGGILAYWIGALVDGAMS